VNDFYTILARVHPADSIEKEKKDGFLGVSRLRRISGRLGNTIFDTVGRRLKVPHMLDRSAFFQMVAEVVVMVLFFGLLLGSPF
jgi:hypothetical protein